MHISTKNISKMVTKKANISSAIKYEIAYGLSISIFIFDIGSFRVPGQGHGILTLYL